MTPIINCVGGVSGVGKTSTLNYLKNALDQNLFDVRDLDERGVPDGGGIDWLNSETRYWLDVANQNAEKGKSTIICGFANPELFEKVYNSETDIPALLVLLNASPEVIKQRLLGRHNTPETIKEIERASGTPLDTYIEGVITFAPQFKKIFEDRGLPIIETDDKSPKEVASEVVEKIRD